MISIFSSTRGGHTKLFPITRSAFPNSYLVRRFSHNIAISFNSISDLVQQWKEIQSIFSQSGFVRLKASDTKVSTLKKVAGLFGFSQKHIRNPKTGVSEIVGTPLSNLSKKTQIVSNHTFFPHTDGTYLNGIISNKEGKYFQVIPPGFIVLQCVQPAVKGGTSIFVDAQKILRKMIINKDPLLPFLFASEGISILRGDHLVVDVPIFKRMANGKYAIRFSYDKDMLCLQAFKEAITAFNIDYIQNPIFASSCHLETHDIVVIDNLRILHARTSYEGQRILRRLWIHDEWNTKELVNVESRTNEKDPYYAPSMTSSSPLKKYTSYNKIEDSFSNQNIQRIDPGIYLSSQEAQKLQQQLAKK